MFDRYDGFGKQVAKSFLTETGHRTINENEAYGSHDFIVEKNAVEKKVEVEVVNGWKHDMFPFSAHHVSYRKRTSKADVFIQVNARGTAIAVCDMSVVLNSPVIRKDCRLPDGRTTKNEPFFAVPISQMRYYYCTDGVWYEDDD
jgi:hypothetical protein